MDPTPGSVRRTGVGSVLVASLVSPDTDGDGLDDDWERSFFDSLQGGPDDDPDADGITSLQELIAGTLPDSAGSTLRLRPRIGESGSSRVEWDGVFGRRYELIRIPEGANGTPQVIGAVDGTGASVVFEDLRVPGETAALYRVRVHRSSE